MFCLPFAPSNFKAIWSTEDTSWFKRIYLLEVLLSSIWEFLLVVCIIFTRPTGLLKYGTTRKNTQRNYTTKRLIRDLLSSSPNCYVLYYFHLTLIVFNSKLLLNVWRILSSDHAERLQETCPSCRRQLQFQNVFDRVYYSVIMCQCRDERQNISGCFCFVFSRASFRDENFTSAKMFSASSRVSIARVNELEILAFVTRKFH